MVYIHTFSFLMLGICRGKGVIVFFRFGFVSVVTGDDLNSGRCCENLLSALKVMLMRSEALLGFVYVIKILNIGLHSYIEQFNRIYWSNNNR